MNKAAPKRENIFLNIGLNVFVPSGLLMKLESWTGLDTITVLVIALAFPIAYGVYDFAARGKYNFFSVLGFFSVLISGGIGVFELDSDWIAVKEAAIPALFGIATLVSLKTPFPLVRTFLYNPEIFDVPKIEAALKEKQSERQFETLMTHCTLYLVGSFAISAVLNYVLAKYFIHSETGTPEFNEELGRMTLWSYFVIMIPCVGVMMFALTQLISGIEKHTGFEMEDVVLIGRPNDVPEADDPDDAPKTSEEA